MAVPFGRRVLVAAAVALQGLADGLVVDPAAAGRGALEAQQPRPAGQRGTGGPRSRLESVDPMNASQVVNLARTLKLARDLAGRSTPPKPHPRAQRPSTSVGPSPVLDERMRRWLSEADKASDDLDREVSEQEGDLREAVPKSKEEKDLERLHGMMDAVDPMNASELSGLGDSLDGEREGYPESKFEKDLERLESILEEVDEGNATEVSELGKAIVAKALAQDGWPRRKVTKYRHLRKAPRLSRRKREAIAKAMVEDLKVLMANMSNDTNKVDTSADQERDTIERIVDKYELESENVSGVDIIEQLYPSNDGWYNDAVDRLHRSSENETLEISGEIYDEVERLQAELEKARDGAGAAEQDDEGEIGGEGRRQIEEPVP